jgi:HEPN domain-containing protein
MSEPDPVLEEVSEWLYVAYRDLYAGFWDLKSPVSLAESCMFHAQQAAEKSLKALLLWHDSPFRKTHNMEELCGQCKGLDAAVDVLLPNVMNLTPFAALTRYPLDDETEWPTDSDARIALRNAYHLYELVCAALPVGASPTGIEPIPSE